MEETTEKGVRGSDIVLACEGAYDAINALHPELPNVVVVTGRGSTARSIKWGHFARDRWTDALINNRRPELLITGERLACGAEDVLSTLLHECAHGLAVVREIVDTSPSNHNYHNKEFKRLAEELTLKVRSTTSRGFSHTEITDETRSTYADALAILEGATKLYMDTGATTSGATRRKDKNLLVAVCDCIPPRKIRASHKVLYGSPITCGDCLSEFQENF